jgi:hypothetical protein
MRKINSTTLEFKRKKEKLMPYLLQEKLGTTTTKVTNTYTCKTKTKPMHKHNQNTILYT